MKVFIRLFLIALFCGAFNQLSAQNYRYGFKFNYGIINYNEHTSEIIQKPLDNPFSFGFRFESDLSKAFSNSLGFSTYKWANQSSYSIQEMLFLRNNAKLLNRLRPQVGFGLGFEESKTKIGNSNAYQQHVFIPLGVGFLTDLSNRFSLGLFGEVKYGFDLKDFNLKKGTVLPNNTAGISLIYRFSKIKSLVAYPEINWRNSATLISIDDLKSYNSKRDLGVGRSSADATPVDLEPLLSISPSKDPNLESLTMKRIEPSILSDSPALLQTEMKDSLELMLVPTNPSYTRYHSENYARQKNETPFTLSDFETSNSRDPIVFQPDLTQLERAQRLIEPSQEPYNQSAFPSAVEQSYPNYDTRSVVQEREYQTPVIESPFTNETAPLKTEKTSAASDVLQGTNVVGNVALASQMSQLIEMQKHTLEIVNKQITQNSSLSNVTLDSLTKRINQLEKLVSKLDNKSKTENLNDETSAGSRTAGTNVVTFSIINYPVNEVNLTDLQRNIIINQIYKDYISASGLKISVSSFTDRTGPSAYNKKLSDARLKNVYRFLMMLGVKSGDIKTESYGDSKSSEEANPEERRIEIKLINNQNGNGK